MSEASSAAAAPSDTEHDSTESRCRELASEVENLKNENLLLRRQRNYGLVWELQPEDVEQVAVRASQHLPVLQEEPKLAVGQGHLTHLLIEGDNYEALLALNCTHKAKIDLIYIDPPYNDGGDYLYNNKLVNPEDNYFHSKWLSFMEKRFALAWDLLTDQGVVFVQIGLDEMARLRLLGDQTFGPENFVTTIPVRMSIVQGPKVAAAKQGNLVKNAEYIHVWAKNGRKAIGVQPLYEPALYDEHYSLFLQPTDKEGEYKEESLGIAAMRDADVATSLQRIGLLNDSGKLAKNRLADAYELSEEFRRFIHENGDLVARDHWTDALKNIPSDVTDALEPGRIIEWQAQERSYLLTKNSKGTVSQRIPLREKIQLTTELKTRTRVTTIRGDWWDGYYLDMGNVGKEDNIEFLNGKKPLRLMKDIIRFASGPDATVLDFFAGSGTTGRAVLSLNAEEAANRRFILVTNNEFEGQLDGGRKGICRAKTYPRLKKVIEDYRRSYGKDLPSNLALRFFTANKSFVERSEYPDDTKAAFRNQCLDTLRVREECYDEVLRDPAFAIFERPDALLAVLLDTRQRKRLFTEIKRVARERQILFYAFSFAPTLDATPYREALGEVELRSIPTELLNTYERLFRRRLAGEWA